MSSNYPFEEWPSESADSFRAETPEERFNAYWDVMDRGCGGEDEQVQAENLNVFDDSMDDLNNMEDNLQTPVKNPEKSMDFDEPSDQDDQIFNGTFVNDCDMEEEEEEPADQTDELMAQIENLAFPAKYSGAESPWDLEFSPKMLAKKAEKASREDKFYEKEHMENYLSFNTIMEGMLMGHRAFEQKSLPAEKNEEEDVCYESTEAPSQPKFKIRHAPYTNEEKEKFEQHLNPSNHSIDQLYPRQPAMGHQDQTVPRQALPEVRQLAKVQNLKMGYAPRNSIEEQASQEPMTYADCDTNGSDTGGRRWEPVEEEYMEGDYEDPHQAYHEELVPNPFQAQVQKPQAPKSGAKIPKTRAPRTPKAPKPRKQRKPRKYVKRSDSYIVKPWPKCYGDMPGDKPPMTYQTLIMLACVNSPTGQVTPSDVYCFILHHWPYYRTANESWKNSCRNLLNNKFVKEMSQASDGKHEYLYSICADKEREYTEKDWEYIIHSDQRGKPFYDKLLAGEIGLPRALFYFVIGLNQPAFAGPENSALFYHMLSIGHIPEPNSPFFVAGHQRSWTNEPKFVEEKKRYSLALLEEWSTFPFFGVNLPDEEAEGQWDQEQTFDFYAKLDDYFHTQNVWKEAGDPNWETPNIDPSVYVEVQ